VKFLKINPKNLLGGKKGGKSPPLWMPIKRCYLMALAFVLLTMEKRAYPAPKVTTVNAPLKISFAMFLHLDS
jgi:hypothetical protein